MSQKKTSTGEYLDAFAVARILDINRETVYRAIARGEIRALKIGSSLRICRKQIDDLLIGQDPAEGLRDDFLE